MYQYLRQMADGDDEDALLGCINQGLTKKLIGDYDEEQAT